ncbi:hypothetical protein TTHERM_00703890 (macronuclear) [Tetrahymena thermophila SB210]|uniref:Uncharacterized protein n=1 Tax=Tetrahymena thermophila (strain SB210) TaxID=312017 RepID=Q22GD4_TETTS|nr:hypothetical protein TTHERM_00703890 [Tetrahymena thermophila SB210]EAR84397.1 hypothetical protein TTHERM_00703890 [Tetrahymena thermophila SB210]|eukprot:XP_001032060.1 hypothetical protein TTHERM_00703890 [Tetrahymena thermophila SB210]
MDKNKYEFLNSLLDKEIEIAKNRSLSFTDSRNSFLTNVHKSNLSTSQNNQDQSQQKLDNLQNFNIQNETLENSTANNSYMLNNVSNNKSLTEVSYEDNKKYEKQKKSDFLNQLPMQQNYPQQKFDQKAHIFQNNLFENNINQDNQAKAQMTNQELSSSNNRNSFRQNNGNSGNDSSFISNSKYYVRQTPDSYKQKQYAGESSQKNQLENSITNYSRNDRGALQNSINQSSGFSPFQNNKYNNRNAEHSPDAVLLNQQQINEIPKVSNPIAAQAYYQLDNMKKQISGSSFSPNKGKSLSSNNNSSLSNINHSQRQQKLSYQNYQDQSQYKQNQSFDTNFGQSHQLSYSINQQYDSTTLSSEEKRKQFQKEFESIQNKIQALEDKLKITEKKNQQLGGFSQENNSIVSLQNGVSPFQESNEYPVAQNKGKADISIFTNPTIKQTQMNNSIYHNQISPRFNIQDSIFFQQQDKQSKDISPKHNNQIQSKQSQQQKSSSGKKKKSKTSTKRSETNSDNDDSGLKPKNLNETTESSKKYIKQLKVQILNDSKDFKEETTQKSKQIRFKTPNRKNNSSLPPFSYNIQPSSTQNTNKQQTSPFQNNEEKNMYSEEIKALQKEYQMWEQRRDKQRQQLQHMQENNNRNNSKLQKLKKQANKLIKLKKEQDLHMSEYDQCYHNFEKCELIRQKQKILISCLKDELKLLQKKNNTQNFN